MGLFSGVGKAAGAVAKSPVGIMSPLGLAAPIAGGAFSSTPEEDDAERQANEARKRQLAALSHAKNVQGTLTNQAKDYRANLPGMQQLQGAQAGDARRRQLAQTLSQVKAGANSRGLLYSGLKQKADADATTDTYSHMASDRARINEDLTNRAEGMENSAIDRGFQLTSMENEANDRALQRALDKRKADMAGAGGVGAVAGKVTGGLLGSG